MLASLPIWALTAAWLVVYAAWAFGVRRLMRRSLSEAERTRAATIAGPLMPALGAAFALLAALSLAGTASELRATEDEVSTEAAQASRLAWSATGPGIDTAGVQEALAGYLQSTRDDEWSDPDEGGNEETRVVLAELERRTRADAAATDIPTPHATELLNALDGITSARRERLASAHHDLPLFYLAVVAVAGLALIANSSALTLNDTRRLALLPTGLVAVVALSMALLLAIGNPFSGSFVASGDPIDQVVADIRAGLFRV